MNGQWGGGSRSLEKAMRALKMKSAVTSYRKLMTTEGIITADALTTT